MILKGRIELVIFSHLNITIGHDVEFVKHTWPDELAMFRWLVTWFLRELLNSWYVVIWISQLVMTSSSWNLHDLLSWRCFNDLSCHLIFKGLMELVIFSHLNITMGYALSSWNIHDLLSWRCFVDLSCHLIFKGLWCLDDSSCHFQVSHMPRTSSDNTWLSHRNTMCRTYIHTRTHTYIHTRTHTYVHTHLKNPTCLIPSQIAHGVTMCCNAWCCHVL